MDTLGTTRPKEVPSSVYSSEALRNDSYWDWLAVKIEIVKISSTNIGNVIERISCSGLGCDLSLYIVESPSFILLIYYFLSSSF